MIEWQKRDRSGDRPQVDLDALNPSEREALALLAEGHTAKSIAMLTGRSVAAVNERLREARRKTGLGSSRELARLYAAAHKNRDEKIDLAAVPLVNAAPAPLAGAGWRKGRIVMPLILVGGLSAALIAASQQAAPNNAKIPADPLILSALSPIDLRTQEAELHEIIRREIREDAWAEDAEMALRTRYSEIPHVNDRGKVRVSCAASLCEVAQILPGMDQVNQQEQEALYQALEGSELRDGIEKLGLIYESSSIKDDGTTRHNKLLLAYWSRWQQPKADPLLDGKLGENNRGERGFYTQLREESRDPGWADHTERHLTSLLMALPALAQGDHRIRVNCAATLCEISAVTVAHPTQSENEAFYEDLQTDSYNGEIEKLGLKEVNIGIGRVPSDTDRSIYVAYYRRNGA